MYQIVVALTVFAHFAFMCYLVVGGFLALRWRRTFWLHVPTAVWGFAINTAHLDCPLTWLERWSRAKAGMSPLPPDGFVAHYITGVLYPTDWLGAVQVVVFSLVAVSWGLYVWQGLRRRRSAH
ncbi:DUF2784 domain-containing protein [Mycobacterium sp. pUA109]|uniref:DUF2784 domain-containing protein n=1 Tax=Mycobacterium sp. pUA109 TaxID=3238982 RepID=UPI00351BD0E3